MQRQVNRVTGHTLTGEMARTPEGIQDDLAEDKGKKEGQIVDRRGNTPIPIH